MLTVKKATIRRSKRRDRIARWVITLGGVTVIALGVELDAGQQRSLTAYVLSRDGTFTFLDLDGGLKVAGSQRVAPPEGSKDRMPWGPPSCKPWSGC